MEARRYIGATVAALGALLVAFAVADAAGSGSEQPEDRLVPAEECGAAVNDAWREVGMPRDSYYPGCPTVEQARETAHRFNEQRRRGLTAIAAGIRRHADSPDDEAHLEKIEAELERLGGPLGHPYAEAEE